MKQLLQIACSLLLALFCFLGIHLYIEENIEPPPMHQYCSYFNPLDDLEVAHIVRAEQLKKENYSEAIQILVTKEDKEDVKAQVSALLPEIRDLSKVIYREGGGESLTYQSAVAWCVLNRVDRTDAWGNSISSVIKAPNQFAWFPSTPVYETQLNLATDVVTRWLLEKKGYEVQRTLPADYYYFAGDGVNNYFRRNFHWDGTYWTWTLPSPY